MILYFSGTGNSRYCAQALAHHLNDNLDNSVPHMKSGRLLEFSSDSPWIFVAPTYAWQLPRIFVDFLRKTRFHGSKDAYFVMTCGSEVGNAEESNHQLCKEIGLIYRGTLQVEMPENYIALFDVPSEEKCHMMLHNAGILLEGAADLIRADEDFPQKKQSLVDKLKSGAVNRGFYQYYVKADKFYATAQCVGCGKCEKLCPLNNIKLQKHLPVWGKHCTHCMACICSCPVGAIEYGKTSRGKRRYLCPEYKE